VLWIDPLTNEVNGKRMNQNDVRFGNECGNAVLREIIEMKMNLVKCSLERREKKNQSFLLILLYFSLLPSAWVAS